MSVRIPVVVLLTLVGATVSCGEPTEEVTPDGGYVDAVASDSNPDGPGASDAPVSPVPDGACGPAGREACTATDPRACPPEIFIGPIGLRDRMVGLIGEARRELRVAIYEIDSAPILRALEAAVGRGVAVRLIVDGEREANIASVRTLRAAGVEVKHGASSFPYYHPKYLIVDHSSATVMSANLNDYSMQSERNHGATLRDPQDIDDLVSLFEADWVGGDPSAELGCTRLVLSPVNSRERLHALIRSAEDELRIQHLSLSDRSTRTLLAQRAAAGVRVQVLLAHPEWIESNATAAEVLREVGVEVRFQRDLENHTKLMIADSRAASVGSINLSYTSLTRNREVSVIITDADAVDALSRSFDGDWSSGAAR